MAFSFKRVKDLLCGRFICRIYDDVGIVHEDFDLLQACQVFDRLRKSNPFCNYQLRLECIDVCVKR